MSSDPPPPPARIRLEFDDRHLLSKPHRAAGLRRCWLLLRPHFHTVADVTSHLAESFNIAHESLILSIDGYVLPPFESVSIFRDGDAVRVRKKVVKQKKLCDNTHGNQRPELLETRSLVVNNTYLTIEDSRGDLEYRRGKSVENAHEVKDISVSVRTASNGETSFKRKRELSNKPKESKRKKLKINYSEEPTITDKEKEVEADHSEKLHHKTKHRNDISGGEEILDKPDSSPIDEKRKKNITREMRSGDEEDCGAVSGEVEVCGNAEKPQSRSARRKKAKRQMRREMAKQQMGEQVKESQKVADDTQGAILNKSIVDQRINAYLEESKSPKNHIECEIVNHHKLDRRIDVEEVVPIIVRPGHIRFGSIDEEHDEPQSKVQMDALQWNGVTNKKKGQKWGREKTSSRDNGNTFCNGATNGKLNTDETKHVDENNTDETKHVDENNINFESLFPLTRSPKEGDVLVYRVVELSSSWCPELSSFRVGRVSSYDNISLKIVLLPVPEYPIFSNEEKDAEHATPSTYLEDGSLEIEYPSLVDVRLLKACESEATVAPGLEKEISKESAPSNNLEHALVKYSTNGAIVPVAETNRISGWEQINQALSEKKTELEKKDDWGTWKRNENAFVPWPYRGPKRHALGPTLALLRGISGNGGKSSGRGKYSKPR